MKSARSQGMDRTIDTPRAHHAELGAAGQEDEAGAVAESLELLAGLEAAQRRDILATGGQRTMTDRPPFSIIGSVLGG